MTIPVVPSLPVGLDHWQAPSARSLSSSGTDGPIVVIGASMAGLMAAAALARHYPHILVIDSDPLPLEPLARKATPQCHHVHGLLQAGQDVLRDYVPDLAQTLRDNGGLTLNVRQQWRTYGTGQWIAPDDTGLTILSQTRPLLEWAVRHHLMQNPAIKLAHGRVAELEQGADGRISGLTILQGKERITQPARLVVDASGRSGRSEYWLKKAQVTLPPVQTFDAEVRYTSALYTRSVTQGEDLSGWLMFATPPATKGAVVVPVEDGQWLVTAINRFGEKISSDQAAFDQFIAGLSEPKFRSLLEREEPTSGFSSYRIAQVRLRRFDQQPDACPPGYVPIGDVMATFNPIFAQGITAAALQAKALERALEQVGTDPDFSIAWSNQLVRTYLPQAMRPARTAWLLGQAIDSSYPHLADQIEPEALALHDLLVKSFRLSMMRPELKTAIDRVIHLLDPLESLEESLQAAA